MSENGSHSVASPPPASQFYWGDWQRDTGVRLVSLAARGLWFDMLCIMHRGQPRGHLTTPHGKSITPIELARMVGAPASQVKALLKELGDAGVYSTADDGTLYNRRMVRDTSAREAYLAEQSEKGRRGAAARWGREA